MNYSVKYKKSALKKLNNFDAPIRERIKTWIDTNLVGCENPRRLGKALHGDWDGFWRYRVGDYRLVAEIFDDQILILIVNVDKRDSVYK